MQVCSAYGCFSSWCPVTAIHKVVTLRNSIASLRKNGFLHSPEFHACMRRTGTVVARQLFMGRCPCRVIVVQFSSSGAGISPMCKQFLITGAPVTYGCQVQIAGISMTLPAMKLSRKMTLFTCTLLKAYRSHGADIYVQCSCPNFFVIKSPYPPGYVRCHLKLV